MAHGQKYNQSEKNEWDSAEFTEKFNEVYENMPEKDDMGLKWSEDILEKINFRGNDEESNE